MPQSSRKPGRQRQGLEGERCGYLKVTGATRGQSGALITACWQRQEPPRPGPGKASRLTRKERTVVSKGVGAEC